MVPGAILFALLSVAAVRAPSLISGGGIGSAVIVVAPLILATYALTVIVMAGRAGVDLSIGPLIGFINVGLIKLLEAGLIESPIAVFLYAMAVGVAYQLLMGLIIVYVRVQPIIVSLSGYLALVGLNLLIMPRPGGVAPDWMLSWGSGTTVFSPILIIIVIATVAWYIIARSAFFGHLRLMGSDERAAYTSGVRINIVRLGAHCIAGVYAGLAAICFTSLISSGDPTQGTTFTLMAVTALVLGGANLAGGRGGAMGSLLGALNIYLITFLLATFNLGTIQSYVTDLAYGAILVASLLISSALPQIQRAARYLSPALFFAILVSVGAGIILHATIDGGYKAAITNAARQPDALAAGGAGSVLQAGSVIMFVVIGLVALGYLLRLLIGYPRAPMVSLVVVVAIVGLGLIFHSRGAGGISAPNRIAAPLNDYALDYFSLEGARPGPVAGNDSSPVVGVAYAVMFVLGVILLVSMIIPLNLFDANRLEPATLRLLLLALLGLGVMALIAVLSRRNAGASSLFGVEGLSVVSVGVILFVLMWSPLQTKVRSIANVYIVALGIVAFGSLYFSAGANTDHPVEGAVQTSYLRTILKAPVINTAAIAARPGHVAPDRGSAAGSMLALLSYSILIIIALHFALWLAMRGRKRAADALPFGCIVISAALAWAALFHTENISLANIAVVVVVAIVTAPLSWRVIESYARPIDRSVELVEAAIASNGRSRELRK